MSNTSPPSPGEFSLIDQYFTRPWRRDQVVLSVGDDAAITCLRPGYELATTVDTLVEGVHFLPGCDPASIGHKSLAVSLSDLAAMGAEPLWYTLALTMPSARHHWLERFSTALHRLAERSGIALVGGDTTRGPLSVTINACGELPQGSAIRRSGAGVGDSIWVSGPLGDAALALAALQGREALSATALESLRQRLEYPEPRVGDGIALRGVASAMIDLSDGLIADLDHILVASGVGGEIVLPSIPLSHHFRQHLGERLVDGLRLALSGGDDYELLCTIPPQREVEWIASGRPARWQRIGTIVGGEGITLVDPEAGRIKIEEVAGYRHFEDG